MYSNSSKVQLYKPVKICLCIKVITLWLLKKTRILDNLPIMICGIPEFPFTTFLEGFLCHKL